MTAPPTSLAPPLAGKPHVVLRGRAIPVVWPSRRDPRLKLSAVILSIQVLGQTLLGFKLSIAQILVTIGVCAVVELAVTYHREDRLVWPASGILTGNSVALLLRASGTRHGDWWSLHGIEYFLLAALLALLSKYLIRPGGKHLFNPSNVALVWTLLIIGPNHVFPQYLWWGPNDLGVALAYAVIVIGAVWILPRVKMASMATAFMLTFAVLVGIFALAGQSFIAIWHDGPISGASYWVNIALSPEVLVFVFFMMSDPQTAPKARFGKIAYGAATAVVAAALLAFQPTEFGIKLAILASLTVVCTLVPLIETVAKRMAARGQRALSAEGAQQPRPRAQPLSRRLAAAVRNPVVIAAAIIAVGAMADTAALVGNQQVVNIERGLTGKLNPQ